MVNTRSKTPGQAKAHTKQKCRSKISKLQQEVLWSQRYIQAERLMQQMWRFHPFWKFYLALQKSTSVRVVINVGTSQACALWMVNKNKLTTRTTNQRHISWLLVQSRHMTASQIQKAKTTHSASNYKSNMYKHRTKWIRDHHAWSQISHTG